MRTFVFTHYIK